MRFSHPTRPYLTLMLLLCGIGLLLSPQLHAQGGHGQGGQHGQGGHAQVGQHAQGSRGFGQRMPPRRRVLQGQPLAQWMQSHHGMSVPDQQRALEQEPGFHDLPQQTQQRMRDQLTHLNNMPPAQRQRVLDRTEMLAELTPQQRMQVRGAMQQYTALPPERRRIVGHAFGQLRRMPEDQRQAYMNANREQFSEQERVALSGLLSAEPYIPVPN
jgi:hypothetical protein